jgi:hypothetical protein
VGKRQNFFRYVEKDKSIKQKFPPFEYTFAGFEVSCWGRSG